MHMYGTISIVNRLRDFCEEMYIPLCSKRWPNAINYAGEANHDK